MCRASIIVFTIFLAISDFGVLVLNCLNYSYVDKLWVFHLYASVVCSLRNFLLIFLTVIFVLHKSCKLLTDHIQKQILGSSVISRPRHIELPSIKEKVNQLVIWDIFSNQPFLKQETSSLVFERLSDSVIGHTVVKMQTTLDQIVHRLF